MKGDFVRGLERFAEKSRRTTEQVRRGVTLKLFTAIIFSTPVGNDKNWKTKAPPGYVGGRLRGNWHTAVGTPVNTVLHTVDPKGRAAIADATNNLGRGDVEVHLTNNLPYAYRIEYDGHSAVEAPAGMVRINVDRFKTILGETIREVT